MLGLPRLTQEFDLPQEPATPGLGELLQVEPHLSGSAPDGSTLMMYWSYTSESSALNLEATFTPPNLALIDSSCVRWAGGGRFQAAGTYKRTNMLCGAAWFQNEAALSTHKREYSSDSSIQSTAVAASLALPGLSTRRVEPHV